MVADPRDLVGRTLGNYQLDRPLGSGAMGIVFLGHEIADPTHIVAIKAMPPGWQLLAQASFDQTRQRFQHEVQILRGLRHPHILRLLADGEDQGILYMVLPYMAGKTLAERIAADLLPLAEVARIGEQIADALAHAHHLGVIHRDIKPTNVLLDDQDQVYLADFGIAKIFDISGMPLTATGQMLGTPGYIAPEVAMGDAASPLSDQYGLGVLYYEMVTGRNPAQVRQNSITPAPDTLRRDLPAAASAAIQRAMSSAPSDRYPNVRDFAAAFTRSIQPTNLPHAATDIDAPSGPTQISPASYSLSQTYPAAKLFIISSPMSHIYKNGITRRALLATGVAGAAVAVLGGGFYWFTHLPANHSHANQPKNMVPAPLKSLGFVGKIYGSVKVILPPVVNIPAGPFLMGSDPAKDPDAIGNEEPQSLITIASAFQIGQYPVTVAEYALAVQAGAVRQPPDDNIVWQVQLHTPDHPVVNVAWADAVQYTTWLAKITGDPWRLPTEAEWEKAARGTDGRIYPWGNQWDSARANTADGGKGTTTPVGAYAVAGDASPYGAHDMAGNAWQWCSTILEPYPYDASDGRENMSDTTSAHVIRGGSWFGAPTYARAASRGGLTIGNRGGDLGFRLARATPPGYD